MERIESQGADQAELAHEVIAWIVHARRRLTTMELQEALGVEIGEDEFDSDNCPDIDYVVSVCAVQMSFDWFTTQLRNISRRINRSGSLAQKRKLPMFA
jgi:hypothetical protein